VENRRPLRANGATPAARRELAVAGGAALAFDDPMARVLGLDASSGPARWLGYILAAIALMLGLAVSARGVAVLVAMSDRVVVTLPAAQEIEIEEAPPPPPETPPPPEPAVDKVEPPAPPPRAAPRESAPPPPPAPAQAGKVLTQEPDPNEPLDLTGNTIVSGNADSYAGGVTAANGTSPTPVRTAAAPNGASGTGAPAATTAPRGPDRSRRASLGSREWDCPFPVEADTVQINDAYVTLEIDVRPDGSASAVRVLQDPGNGFGRQARQYALKQHYESGLDRDGNPIAQTIRTRVHFSR
jgi:protein TonB